MATVTQDPRTGESAPPVEDTSPGRLEDILAAVAAAAPFWAASPLTWRVGALRAVADALDGAGDELVALADEESALGTGRLTGELARTTGQLRFLGDVITDGGQLGAMIDTADPGWVPTPRPDLRRTAVPIGPVIVFAASNFPFAFSVAGGDTAAALAAGCPVVVKAHPGHPRLSARVGDLLSGALTGYGAPAGSCAVVHGVRSGVDALRDRRISAAAFTGSLSGGRALFDIAAARPDPIPFYGELGSINPVVITAAALARRADELVEGLVASFTLGVGQFCTKPGVVLVPAGSGFEHSVAARAAAVAEAPMLTAGLRDAFRREVLAVAGSGAAHRLLEADGDGERSGAWQQPTVLYADAADLIADPGTLLSECFGPATLVVGWADEAELGRALQVLPGSLTATLHAEAGDDRAGLGAALAARAGRVLFGGWPTGVAVSWAQHHGGPYPATTDPLHTSVGAAALHRFLRPVTYQDAPEEALPPELRDDNPLGILRRVDGSLTRAPVS